MAKVFDVSPPASGDVGRIAAIHLAAMDSNPLLHAQFPTPESLRALERFLEAYSLEKLSNPSSGILVARDPASGQIASFARWDYPSHGDSGPNKVESSELKYSEGCRREFLDGYAALATEAKKRCFGETPCYSLSFVCTDPAYQGQGAGSLLIRHVMERARMDGMPVYLESTALAVPMYEKLGFRTIDRFEMRIPRREASGASEVYLEECMVWGPGTALPKMA